MEVHVNVQITLRSVNTELIFDLFMIYLANNDDQTMMFTTRIL